MSVPSPLLQSSRRFELVRHLGSGGSGTVFEAVDRERGARVALKTLKSPTAEGLLQLKNEFRSLQDLRHPNLVNLLELVEEDGRFFVAMELVDGADFLAHVRRGPVELLSGCTETRRVRAPEPPGDDSAEPGVEAASPEESSCDVAALRAALAALSEALCFLHDNGKLHRDVKPANVLVTREGRVVLLDFGLARDVVAPGAPVDSRALGTRAFMAPEQAAGQHLTSAADWYSVGVLLYLALTGSLPFQGADLQRKKLRGEAPAITERWPTAPVDLAELCLALLAVDPALRPSGREVLARLGAGHRAPDAPQAAPLLGREPELTRLLAGFSASRAGATSTVLIVADSGVGKSALVREFAARLTREQPDALLLAGRCYERELVPYKAFDGIVDALSTFLCEAEPAEASGWLPEGARVLVRLFPVLARVPALLAQAPVSIEDPQELRAAAFASLCELLRRVALARPLLLFIDDLQWADEDSYVLLSDLLRAPAAPPFCLLATARPAAQGAADHIALFSEHWSGLQRLELGPLARAAAQQLAESVLRDSGRSHLAERIAVESGGHALFVLTLAEHARLNPEFAPGALRLEDALLARVGVMELSARRLLELVAIAGVPLAEATAAHAAELEQSTYLAAVSALRAARLLRSSFAPASGLIEPYHDRVRETLLAALTAGERRERHLRLANALAAAGRGGADPSALVRHLESAGQLERAAQQAELAARHAEGALAFEQAAELYRTALRLGTFEEAARRALTLALAKSLTNAGRAAEAAETYLELAASAEPAQELEYHRRAADHMLRSGHLERGSAILSDVLVRLNAELMPQWRALLTTLYQRLRLRLRGLQWTPRAEPENPPLLLQRIDAYHAVGVSLALIDPVRGAAFEARALRLALEAGDARRLVPTLLMEAGYEASIGASGLAYGRRLYENAQRIAEATKEPYAKAIVTMMDGFLDYHAGDFAKAARTLGEAGPAFAALPACYFEQAFCHCFRLICLRNRGMLGELQQGFFEWVTDAQRRGDFFSEASLRFNLSNVWLARDEPDAALADLARVRWIPPQGGYHVQHWYEQQARVEIDLYSGRAELGLARFRQEMKALSRSFILRMRLHRAHARWLLGRLLLASAVPGGPEAAARIDEVRRLAKKLAREGLPCAAVWAQLLTAGAHHREGNQARAQAELERALAGAERFDLPHCANAARFHLSALVAGSNGDSHAAQARAWAERQRIERPERMFATWVPGF